jgi:ribonuclease-3 family protein
MTDYFDLNFETDDIQKISNLGLAHLGDAVYELMVRSWLCIQGKSTSKGLHAAAIKWVAAPAQAEAVKLIQPVLTDEEADVFRRGRNAHVNSVPHSATLEEYHAATGLESLFGYLYLRGRRDRLNELFEMIMNGKS